MHLRTVTLSALAALALTGCGASIEGNWTGTWTEAGGTSGTLKLDLRQAGSDVSGSAVMPGSSCLSNATATGKVDGDKVTLDAVSGSTTFHFTGTVKDNSMSGSYNAASGACSGQSGTWQVTK